jgi:phosphomannomutase
VYFAAFHLELDGGIMVTASHNLREYNGMKLVRSGARPVSGDSGPAGTGGMLELNYNILCIIYV